MKRITITITDDQFEELESLRPAQGMSRSWLIRQMIDLYLAAIKRQPINVPIIGVQNTDTDFDELWDRWQKERGK